MFYLDELYRGCGKYPIRGDALEKYLFYRGQRDDIDVDVCEKLLCVYRATNPLIPDNAQIVQQARFNRSGEKYEIRDGDRVYRGETLINCMQVLLQIANYDEKPRRIRAGDLDELAAAVKGASLWKGQNAMDTLQEFIVECYSEGNFFPIPFKAGRSLNTAKGRLRKKGLRDSMTDSVDTFFQVCRSYFGGDAPYCQLTRYLDEEEEYKVWKERYRHNWKQFVKDYLFEAFTDDRLEPAALWEPKAADPAGALRSFLLQATRALKNRRERIEAMLAEREPGLRGKQI